jgi:hypothetical protein
MKLRIMLPCQFCDERRRVNVELMTAWWEWSCPACGEANAMLTSETLTLGWRILEKARGEYIDSRDNSMTIVLAAMAIEAEIARLYFKWRRVDSMRFERRVPTDQELDEGYRGLGSNIADKIESVARLLFPEGIDVFAATSALAEPIKAGYPSLKIGSLATDLQQTVFWPRNRVIHAGYLAYEAEDERSTNIASMALDLFKHMDLARRGMSHSRNNADE